MNEGILVPITMFAAAFGIIYIYLTTRNKERMMLIEKGEKPDLFENQLKENKNSKGGLKLGVVAIGIGVGIVVANMLESAYLLEDDVAFPAMIFIFGGIGLVASYYISKRSEEEGK